MSFMWSPRNDKYNPHTRKPTVNKNSFMHMVFIYLLTFIFRILRSWKARFSHNPFRPTSYIQKSLKWLEVNNRVRNWNKVKKIHFRGVETWIMPIGNANIHIQFNVSEFNNKLVSFLFCEFNRVTSWKEGKKIILECSSQITK